MSPLSPSVQSHWRRRKLAAAPLALVLVLGACGSDDAESTAEAGDDPTTTVEPNDTEVTTTTDPGEDAPAAAGLMVTDGGDGSDASPGDGECATADGACTLRAAIDEANATEGADTITLTIDVVLAADGAGEDANASGDLDITDETMIIGDGWSVDAGMLDRAFHVLGVPVTIEGLDVTNGIVEGEGASGGLILNDAGTLSVTDGELTNGSATRAGGAIEATEGSTTVLTNVTMSGNATGAMPGNGGAFHLTGAGTVEVTGSTVTGNTAAAEGGGLWNSGAGTFAVTDTVIENNTASGAEADQGGGGLYNDGGTMTVVDSTIVGNVADGEAGSGGGILNSAGTLSVTGGTIEGNTSMRAGGGIEATEGSTTELSGVAITGNETGSSPGNGGGFHITGVGTVDVADSTVTGNTAAAEGGGLWNSGGATMTVTGGDVSGNEAPAGPDLYNVGGPFTVDGEAIPVS